MKTYTLEHVIDKLVGENGTPERENFEFELKMDLVGKVIKKARMEQKLTQEELGKLIGVQKSRISKLENNAGNATMDTLIRVFNALRLQVKLHIELPSF